MAEHFGWDARLKNKNGTMLSLYGDKDKRFYDLLGYIRSGWTPIIGILTDGGRITLEGGSTPHWVAVVGIGYSYSKWIDIFNPYNDRVTRYSWDDFFKVLSLPWNDSANTGTYNHNQMILIKPPSPRINNSHPIPI
ncbi:MAG: hypothetical protein U0X74_02660 [Anaerolineales bacterium]